MLNIFARVIEEPANLRIGAEVRILVGRERGTLATVIDHKPELLIATWFVRPEGWPRELPGLAFDADELEVEF